MDRLERVKVLLNRKYKAVLKARKRRKVKKK